MTRWIAEDAGTEPLEQLIYQSHLVGSQEELVLWGGGNNSVKLTGADPVGQSLDLMLIKGSGSDMRTMTREQFTPLRLDYIRPLAAREAMSDEQMVEHLSRCVMDPGAPRPSIETLLHAFLPFNSVLHTHADAILALTNNRGREQSVRACFESRVAIVPYVRPGFELSRMVATLVREHPEIEGVVLMNHGLITWGADPREAYEAHLRLVHRAEEFISFRRTRVGDSAIEPRRDIAARIAPMLRGMLRSDQGPILSYSDSPDVLEFLEREDAASLSAIGAATPDHLLHTKRVPLFLDLDMEGPSEALRDQIAASLQEYRDEYRRYFESHAQPGDEMLAPDPRVILVRGVGLFSSGKTARTCRVIEDIYRHTLQIITASESVGGYETLNSRDAYHAEYWPLELYKLTLAPKGRELAGKVALVTGAGSGIGRAIAKRFAAEGAHIIVSDIESAAADAVAGEICEALGARRATSLNLDVSNQQSVSRAFERIRVAYGGLDILVSNAGIACVGLVEDISTDDWNKSLSINTTGHFLVARAALGVMKEQGNGGSLLFIATKNVTAPGKAFGAYSVSKAAEAQLCRILAIEAGEYGIRSNMVNPDAVFDGSRLWSEELRRDRAFAHGITAEELPEFYRKRNLLRVPVLAEDVADAALFLAGPRAAKTTGAMLAVDGGLRDAFPR